MLEKLKAESWEREESLTLGMALERKPGFGILKWRIIKSERYMLFRKKNTSKWENKVKDWKGKKPNGPL